MTGRGFLWAAALSLIAWATVAAVLFCASRAFALDYDIWAERPGALLSADKANIRRIDRPAYRSFTDCLDALATDKTLRNESGWRLRCRPTEAAPVPRLVVR